MKASSVQKWVERKGAKYIAIYGLSHWDIEFDVSDDEESGLSGEIDIRPEYEKAIITFFAPNISDLADLHDTLCHELEHILHAPNTLFADMVAKVAPEHLAPYLEQHAKMADEQTRTAIGRFRAALLPEPL
jgi:hypothetical protein